MKIGLSGGGGAAGLNELKNNALALDPWAITAGAVTGAEHVYKFFRNANLGTSLQFISSFGGSTYPYDELTAGTDTMQIVSTDATDTSAGAGARKVRIFGLDTNFDKYDEEFTLNGATPVVIAAGTFKRVYRMNVTEAGVYATSAETGGNNGTITLSMTTSGNTVADIPQHQGGTLMCNYTIPAGHTGYITHVDLNIESGKAMTAALTSREGADLTSAPYKSPIDRLTLDGADSGRSVRFTGAIRFPEKTDIWLEAVAASGTGNKIDGVYDLFVLNNSTFTIY